MESVFNIHPDELQKKYDYLNFKDAYNSARIHILSGNSFTNLKNIQNV